MKTERSSRVGPIAARVGLVLLVLFAAFPFYWAVVASFTPEATLSGAVALAA